MDRLSGWCNHWCYLCQRHHHYLKGEDRGDKQQTEYTRELKLEVISWSVFLTIQYGIMNGVRSALISIFCINSEYFRTLEEKTNDTICKQNQWWSMNDHHHCCVDSQTYRDWDFVDVAKVRGSYKGRRHVLGVEYIHCYHGCGGQHLMFPLVLSSSILREKKHVVTIYRFIWHCYPKQFMIKWQKFLHGHVLHLDISYC